MNKKRKLVFATNNAHKLEEARQIIPDGFEIVSLSEIGCHDDIPETADTLEGNALIKARWVHDKYGCDCFADDTGLMVDALGGAPGVYSARYAGDDCIAANNVAKLLREMKGKEDRHAHFATKIALICDGEEHCFEGRVDGRIATEEHGTAGFGYDPVFIAEETRRCFAEMSADEKNAISHRGRAMRKLKDFLTVIAGLIIICGCQLTARADSWRLHASYDGQTERIIDTPDYTYFLTASQNYTPDTDAGKILYGVIFRYDKEGDEIIALNHMNQLSSDMVCAVEYNYRKKYLAIGYTDGNIDLLYDDGKVVNVPGLRLADASLAKYINAMSIDEDTDRIYVATDFGYLILDGSKGQVITSRNFGTKVTSIAYMDDNIWIATASGIYYGNPNAFNMEQMTKVCDNAPVRRLMTTGANRLLALSGQYGKMQSLVIAKGSNGGYTLTSTGRSGRNIERTRDGAVVVNDAELRFYNSDGTEKSIAMPSDGTGANAGTYDGRNVWLSFGREGFSQRQVSTGGRWTVLKDKFTPNSSAAFHAPYLALHPEYGMLVRNYGYSYIFNESNGTYQNTGDLLSGYKDMNWRKLSTTYLGSPQCVTFYNPIGLEIDPRNPNHVYSGSHIYGLFRLDLSDPEKSLHMSHSIDYSHDAGKPGFITVADITPGDWNRCTFSSPKFDTRGNMWVIYVGNTGNHTDKNTNLWCWTPEDRAATTSASTYRPFKKITVNGVPAMITPTLAVMASGSNKDMLVFHGNLVDGTPSSLVFYDYGGTPEDTSDDKMATYRNITDQDGNPYTLTRVLATYEDPLTGLLWFSTENQLFTVTPSKAVRGEANFRRIKVPRNDGTNLADYLLDNVLINQIISDSRGRKWFATYKSGLVCTSSDGREIIKEFNPDNSDIPSDIVYSVCENPSINSLMVSTEKGLCEYFMSGVAGGDGESDLRVYPNPVKLDYYGYVTIDGLPDDAMIKIIDTTANLVKECGMSSGGQMKWDLTDNAHRRVPGGVYFILATNGPDSDSYAKIGKVLVIE